MSNGALPKETAYYYPEPYWLVREGDWIKNLLLFFDDVAILLPDYMRGIESRADPILAAPLLDRGLLKIIEPEWFVDEDAAGKLTDLITSLIEAGAFDDLESDNDFAEISMSRMGYHGAPELAQKVYEALKVRGLAQSSRDGVSIPMHRVIRATYLIILAQLARSAGKKHGLDLQPISNRPGIERTFSSFFNLEPMPSKGEVVSLDLQVVSVDLARVPLDEILQFRDENQDAHRKYMQNLRTFAAEIGSLDRIERERALQGRKAEIQEEGQALRSLSQKAWGSPTKVTGFALGLAGASLALATAPITGSAAVIAVITAVGALLNMTGGDQETNAYTYLFRAASQLP